MSYPVVPIQAHLGALKQQIDNAKKNGTYAAQQQQWDGEVEKILAKDCPIAEHNVNTSNELIQVQRENAQQAIDLVEKTLKKKEFSQDQLNYIEQVPSIVQQCATRISENLQDLMTANGEYRGGWPATARELLSPQAQGIVNPYEAARRKGIDGQAGIMALKKRVEEYIPRSQEYVKQARQRMSKGDVEINSFNKDMEEIKKKMEDGRDAIRELQAKKKNAIQGIKAIEKTKPWSPDQTKNAKSWLGDICANAKSARGQLKTLEVLYEGLEKRGKAAGPGWKEEAAKAVSEAGKPFKEAISASKTFDADEEKCKKICKDHGVTV